MQSVIDTNSINNVTALDPLGVMRDIWFSLMIVSPVRDLSDELGNDFYPCLTAVNQQPSPGEC